ncbi:flavin reductase family protein [Xylophilus sp.]|uniref:flavin reductase family protein n=1 Tax=Xylophilus sp. TaxID=2653893 RepID=UPI002D7FAA10|nr:flavin reductase family protein [Xylophilus sp.]
MASSPTPAAGFRRPVPLDRATRLLNHGPTVLVSAEHAGRRNVMAAAWNMALDFAPPKVAVVIDKIAFTRGLIEASGRFALSVPVRAQAALTTAIGGTTGKEVDKEAALAGLAWIDEPSSTSPLVEGCAAWLDCRLIPEPHNQQAYDLFLGEVIGAWADRRVYSEGRWHFEGFDDLRTLHHVAGGHYLLPGESVDG